MTPLFPAMDQKSHTNRVLTCQTLWQKRSSHLFSLSFVPALFVRFLLMLREYSKEGRGQGSMICSWSSPKFPHFQRNYRIIKIFIWKTYCPILWPASNVVVLLSHKNTEQLRSNPLLKAGTSRSGGSLPRPVLQGKTSHDFCGHPFQCFITLTVRVFIFMCNCNFLCSTLHSLSLIL